MIKKNIILFVLISITACFFKISAQSIYYGGNVDGFAWSKVGGTGSEVPLDDVSLEIELLYFNATLNNNIIDLTWSTATEINNDYFTVLRSQNGKNFEKIGIVDAAGNSNTILNYQYYDKHPYDGVSYYKLKQTDFDGNYSYSEIRVIIKEGIEIINIYPVPAKDNITIQVASSKDTKVKVNMIDDLGQVVYSNAINAFKEIMNQFNLNISSYSAGIYVLEVKTSDGNYKSQKTFTVK